MKVSYICISSHHYDKDCQILRDYFNELNKESCIKDLSGRGNEMCQILHDKGGSGAFNEDVGEKHQGKPSEILGKVRALRRSVVHKDNKAKHIKNQRSNKDSSFIVFRETIYNHEDHEYSNH
jgi:hypothetical protein